ncbi:ankyrin repeat domain-containing protein [Massilia antarctica]|uniref:ankyrin repeat domain-containing protein n=1 Tax=Massilia antarctica TaxID=2765360 RepID=UPI0006BB8A5D|nr:ankyrin repeat domain-containing protein [Massilia sp. H27-R4]MCY0915720.1 ankyrin repeat domain-containing protein [Massilia sp. H27-R4]CUI02918.1 FOG: Ankyrin repeat [Janthinobacterium sp. CG23_2]CUU26704.1 FOG: Ankyrin repeat [Janthinobacterium sp. CG23_2]
MFNLIVRLLLAASLAILGANAAADPVRDLVLAAQMDNPTMVKKLLKNGVSPNTVDPLTGETVLLLALREGANDVVKLLIGQPGIDLEQAAPNGNRALMMAAFKHNKPAVLALLDKGAIVTYPGWTALHYAAASGDDDIVRILLDHYAYIDAETPSKLTPLMIAAREGHESAARLLMQEGADATLKNNESLTAAQIAERADKPRIADAINAHLSLTRKGL